MTIDTDKTPLMNRERCEIIAKRTFPVVQGKKVLELGPQDGTWFTKHLLTFTEDVTAIEFNTSVAKELKMLFPIVNVIENDFNKCLSTVGEYDAVIVYGVIYHTPSPLLLLEDIANFVKPTYILLENIFGSSSGDMAAVIKEELNIPGMRFAEGKTTGLVVCLGQTHLETAMKNLGYELIDSFDVTTDAHINSLPGEIKKDAYYTIWKLIE